MTAYGHRGTKKPHKLLWYRHLFPLHNGIRTAFLPTRQNLMPDHTHTSYLIIGLVTGFAARFVLLLIFLRIMILFQKMNFTWLPLVGAAFLAASLDMIPMVGHYIAVP